MSPIIEPVLRLEGELGIARAVELKSLLLDHLRGKAQPEVDLSAVSRIDASGIQLLLLANKTASGLGKKVSWTSPSDPVREALRLLGLSEQLA